MPPEELTPPVPWLVSESSGRVSLSAERKLQVGNVCSNSFKCLFVSRRKHPTPSSSTHRSATASFQSNKSLSFSGPNSCDCLGFSLIVEVFPLSMLESAVIPQLGSPKIVIRRPFQHWRCSDVILSHTRGSWRNDWSLCTKLEIPTSQSSESNGERALAIDLP